MPGHRRAHLNEYPPEAQWGCPSEVVTLGVTTGARDKCARSSPKGMQRGRCTGACVQMVYLTG